MTMYDSNKSDQNIIAEGVDDTVHFNDPQRTPPAKKPRSRGRNRPRPPSRRYGWKEAIFGKGYPDLCALREGQPYKPSQEGKTIKGANKDMRQRHSRRSVDGETSR